MNRIRRIRHIRLIPIFRKIRRGRRQIALISLMALIILIPVAIFLLRQGDRAEAGWWPEGTAWAKRQKLTLFYVSASENLDSGTTIAITVNTKELVQGGKLRPDCADLRVIYQPNSSTYTDLPRYLVFSEGGNCATSEATKVHFKLQAQLNTSSQTSNYYLYYANLNASLSPINADIFDTSVEAKFACVFNGTATCINENGAVTATNAAGAIRYGGVKSAMSFNGFNAYVNGGSANIIDNLGAFTAEMWVYPKKLGSATQTFIQKGTITNRWAVQTLDTNKIRFYIDYAQDLIVDSTAVLTENEWQHIAVVWDGDTNAGNTYIYRNGVDVTDSRTNASGSRVTDASGSLFVGAGSGTVDHFYGLIDEVRLSRGARYLSEFTPTTAPFVTDADTLVLYHFDDNGDDARNAGHARDSSFNLNHGATSQTRYVAGLIGVDGGINDTGRIPQQGFVGREGIFLESGTTNKITNPSFEHATYNTGWTASGGTASEITDPAFTKFGSKSYRLVLADATDRTVLTSINVGNTNTHTLSAYVFRGTSGNVGGTVGASVAQLVFNGSAQTTTYSDVGGGWWRLSYSGAGVASAVNYGVQVNEDSGTLYIDGVQLEEKAYASTYADGSLGNGYSWSGTANESTSSRAEAYLEYPVSGHLTAATGSISMWIRRNSVGETPVIFNWQDATGDNYLRITCSNTQCNFAKRIGGAAPVTTGAAVNFGVQTWAFVVATWDTVNGMRMYINNSVNSLSNTTTLTGLNNTFTLGSSTSANGANAYLNDVRFYDSPLTTGEIADMYYTNLVTYSKGYEVDRFSPTKGENPIAIWNFDEGYGQTSRDGANNGYDLTLGGSSQTEAADPTWQKPGNCPRGTCLYFDGTGQYVKTGGLLGQPKNLTISAWIKLVDVDSSGAEIISIGDFVLLRIDNSFGSFYDGTDWRATTYDHNFYDGKWHYITYMIDDDNDSQKIYINGVEVASSAFTGSISYTGQGGDTYLGKHGNGGTTVDLKGFIDEVKVYDYARTREQILVDYNNGAATFSPDQPPFLSDGLVGHWKMDEGTGTNYADASGFGNNLSTQAAPTWTTGKFGYGLDFERDDKQNLQVLDNSVLSITQDLTLSGWIKPEAVTAATMFTITGKWDENQEAYLLSQYGDEIRFNLADPNIHATTTNAGLVAGNWYHVTATYQAKTGQVKIFVNGEEKTLNINGAIPNSLPDTVSAFYIGAYPDPGSGGGATYSSQPAEASMIDTFVREDAPDTAVGTNNSISTFATNGQRRSGLLKFDLSTIPSGSVVTSATLSLYAAASNAGTRSYSAARILAANSGWVEGATWNYANPSTVRWAGDTGNNGGSDAGGSVSGTDYSSTALGTASLTNFAADAEFAFSLNITEVEAMIANNYGIYITRTDANAVFALHSSNATTSTVRPKLVINYTTGTELFDPYDGVIDEVRVYNRALSPAEVQELSNWAPGPVSYHPLDEGTGSVAYDKAGNGFTGTLTNTNAWVPGKIGQGVELNGSNGYIDIGTGPAMVNTVSFWVKPAATTAHLIDLNGSAYISASGGTISATGFSSPAYFVNGAQTATPTLTANVWQHIAVTTATPLNASDYDIGRVEGSGYLNGVIDEVKLYNYPRTAQQVVSDMNAGHPVPGSPVGSALGHWKFDEGGGAIANDSGTAKKTGSITGAVWSNNGKFGNALVFDGSGDYVDLGNQTEYHFGTNSFTITAWINHNVVSGAAKVIFSDGTPTSGWAWQTYSDSFSLWHNSVNKITTPSPFLGGVKMDETNKWYHLAVVRDASSLSYRAYIDGYLVNTTTEATLADYNSASSSRIGATSSSTNVFRGLIDEVKVYNSALSTDQIITEYNRGQSQTLGSLGTTSTGESSNAAVVAYCPPGQSTACVGPLGEWKFDENTGSTANDSSGNGNTGTLTDSNNGSMGSNVWEPGKFGSAIRFDGVNDQVSTNNGNSVKGLTAYTIEAWVKPSVLDGVRRTIFDEPVNGSSNSRIKLTIDTDNRFLFAGRDTDAGTFTNWVDSTTTLSADTWYHVVAVFDSVTDVHRLYLNGQLQTGSVAAAAVSNTDPNYTPRIGGRGVLGQEEPFKGLIDTVRIYNYARTQEQVMWTFNQGAPVGWWKLDEDSGTTAFDASGNGTTGTLTNGPTYVTGKYGKALAFDGSNDFVEINNNAYIGFSGNLSVCSWVKATAGATTKIFVAKGSSGNNRWDYMLYHNSSEGFVFMTYTTGGSSQKATSNGSSLDLNRWYYLCGTFNDTTDEQRLYIDGELIDTQSFSSRYFGSYDLVFGARSNNGTTTFENHSESVIDDVRIYNYALTPVQVKTVMNEGGAVRFGP
jgi:hypothetical protein